MHDTDIRNGQRGHRHHAGGSERAAASDALWDEGAAQILSAEQAAPLLGCTVRHVRRLIASGDLAGHKDPYRTWRSALDAYRHRRQPHEGDVLAHRADTQVSAGGQQGTGSLDLQEEDDQSAAVMVAIAAELAGAREQIERLARENGRLQALVEQQPTRPQEVGLPRPRARPRSKGPLARLLALLW